MPNAGETLFKPTPFVRWTLSPFILIFLIAMPFLISSWTVTAALLLVLVELCCVALLAGFWLPARYSRVGFRVVAALVFVLYLGYLIDQVHQLATSPRPGEVLAQQGSSPIRAIVGMSVIGLPCLWYLIHGSFTRPVKPQSRRH